MSFTAKQLDVIKKCKELNKDLIDLRDLARGSSGEAAERLSKAIDTFLGEVQNVAVEKITK